MIKFLRLLACTIGVKSDGLMMVGRRELNLSSKVEEGSYACGEGVGRREYVHVARAIVHFLVAVFRFLACVLNAFLSRLKHVGGFSF